MKLIIVHSILVTLLFSCKTRTSSQTKEVSTIVNSTQTPINCENSPSPLFSNNDPNTIYQINMQSDYDVLMEDYEVLREEERNPITKGIIRQNTIPNKSLDTLVQLKQRGGSRRALCPWKPIKVIFKESTIVEDSQQNLFDRFNSLPEISEKGFKQGNNSLFYKLGKDIKLVTHCGVGITEEPHLRGNVVLGGKTPEEQDERVLMEYYTYKIMELLTPLHFKTRLLNINYQNTKGNSISSHKGFFLEPRSRVAKRCNLEKEPQERSIEEDIPVNKYWARYTYYAARYVFSYDLDIKHIQNVKTIYDENGKKIFIPYDFDLTGIIDPEFAKNNFMDIEENAKVRFARIIRKEFPEINLADRKKIFQHFLDQENAIHSLIKNSHMQKKNKDRFLLWLEKQNDELKKFL